MSKHMTLRERRRFHLIEARKYAAGSPDRAWNYRAAVTYGQMLRGVPAKDWMYG